MIDEHSTSELGKAIQEVSEKASVLVREEIELAKAEITQKAMGLARGAAIGAAAGVFVLFALIYLLQALSLGIWRAIDGHGTSYYLGFLIVAVLLLALGGLAGYLAARLFKKSSPPVPKMAIQEAQLIKQTVGEAKSGEGAK